MHEIKGNCNICQEDVLHLTLLFPHNKATGETIPTIRICKACLLKALQNLEANEILYNLYKENRKS